MTIFFNILNNGAAKEKLVKFGGIFIALLFVFYLYLIGSLVGVSAQQKYMFGVLEEETQKLNDVERLLMAEGKNFHLSFFKELGYEEPKKFDLIKPTSNVAGIAQLSIHQ